MRHIINFISWVFYLCSILTVVIIAFVLHKFIMLSMSEHFQLKVDDKVIYWIVWVGLCGFIAVLFHKIRDHYEKRVYIKKD